MSGDHDMYLFGDDQDSKMRVKFSIQLYNHEVSIDNEYDDDAQWQEVLDDIVKAVEASYGYSFDLNGLGIYYSGKENA